MKINNVNTGCEKQIAAIRCILSDVTKQSIEMAIADILKGCPTDKEITYKIDVNNYRPGHLSCSIFFSDEKAYDWMMTKKECYINSDVNAQFNKTMVFVSHENTELALSVLVYHKLKDEDFDTLDMLGKVHRSLDKPQMQTSIYCEL